MTKYDLDDLIKIVEMLRGENGCPWDKAQTHETLKSCLLEETYEVIDAIDRKDSSDLTEELGDLLLQIIFHSRLAQERGEFNIIDVIDGISKKMIRRHPHIFGDVDVKDQKEIMENWEKIKNEEKSVGSVTESMKNIPDVMPALMRAYKVQQKASRVGFDWDDVDGAMDKLDEETNELKEVYKGKDRDKIREELGDLLFAIVNVARFVDLDPELALREATEKFIRRFEFVEKSATKLDKRLQDMSLDELDRFWEDGKFYEKKRK